MPTAQKEPSLKSVTFENLVFPLEHIPCDFCGSDQFYPFWSRMRHGLDLPTVLCKRCGLCMTNPRPVAEANDLFYSKLYNRFHKRTGPLTPDCAYVVKSRRLAKPRVELLSRFIDPTSKANVLEIGAGVGQFQLLAREQTEWNLSGIEPGGEQAALCQQLKLNVTEAFFQDLKVADGSQDAVVSFHVFEHLPSPMEFLKTAHRVLRSGGLLYLEVPNLARWGEGTLDNFFQFPHLYSFTATTLRNYLNATGGFSVVYSGEKSHGLTMIAKKTGDTISDHPTTFEQFDIGDLMNRLRLMNRGRRATAWIPRLPILRKIRSTFEMA